MLNPVLQAKFGMAYDSSHVYTETPLAELLRPVVWYSLVWLNYYKLLHRLDYRIGVVFVVFFFVLLNGELYFLVGIN